MTSPQSAPLEIGYSALRISLPVLVAESRGLFKAHGLTITLKRYETAQPLVEEVLDGRVLAAGYAALPIVFTAASHSDSRALVVSAMFEDAEHPVSYLLKKHGDTSLNTVADLRKKRVGVLPTLAYQKWLAAIVTHAGLQPSDVNVVPLAPPQQVSGLAEGVVDALFTNDPMATSALGTGVAERFGPTAPLIDVTGEPIWFGSFLLNPKLVAERPADVDKLVAALDDAIDFINGNQAAARALLSPFLREAERPYVDRYPPARYLKSHEVDVERLARELASEVKLGILEHAPDAQSFLLTKVPGNP